MIFSGKEESTNPSSDDYVKPFDSLKFKKIANTSLDVVLILSRGGTISDGPREVTSDDVNRLPAIFKPAQGKTYMMMISSEEKSLMVVMNETSIIKTVPFSYFS